MLDTIVPFLATLSDEGLVQLPPTIFWIIKGVRTRLSSVAFGIGGLEGVMTLEA